MHKTLPGTTGMRHFLPMVPLGQPVPDCCIFFPKSRSLHCQECVLTDAAQALNPSGTFQPSSELCLSATPSRHEILQNCKAKKTETEGSSCGKVVLGPLHPCMGYGSSVRLTSFTRSPFAHQTLTPPFSHPASSPAWLPSPSPMSRHACCDLSGVPSSSGSFGIIGLHSLAQSESSDV